MTLYHYSVPDGGVLEGIAARKIARAVRLEESDHVGVKDITPTHYITHLCHEAQKLLEGRENA